VSADIAQRTSYFVKDLLKESIHKAWQTRHLQARDLSRQKVVPDETFAELLRLYL
jgi:hypothetical protein